MLPIQGLPYLHSTYPSKSSPYLYPLASFGLNRTQLEAQKHTWQIKITQQDVEYSTEYKGFVPTQAFINKYSQNLTGINNSRALVIHNIEPLFKNFQGETQKEEIALFLERLIKALYLKLNPQKPYPINVIRIFSPDQNKVTEYQANSTLDGKSLNQKKLYEVIPYHSDYQFASDQHCNLVLFYYPSQGNTARKSSLGLGYWIDLCKERPNDIASDDNYWNGTHEGPWSNFYNEKTPTHDSVNKYKKYLNQTHSYRIPCKGTVIIINDSQLLHTASSTPGDRLLLHCSLNAPYLKNPNYKEFQRSMDKRVFDAFGKR